MEKTEKSSRSRESKSPTTEKPNNKTTKKKVTSPTTEKPITTDKPQKKEPTTTNEKTSKKPLPPLPPSASSSALPSPSTSSGDRSRSSSRSSFLNFLNPEREKEKAPPPSKPATKTPKKSNNNTSSRQEDDKSRPPPARRHTTTSSSSSNTSSPKKTPRKTSTTSQDSPKLTASKERHSLSIPSTSKSSQAGGGEEKKSNKSSPSSRPVSRQSNSGGSGSSSSGQHSPTAMEKMKQKFAVFSNKLKGKEPEKPKSMEEDDDDFEVADSQIKRKLCEGCQTPEPHPAIYRCLDCDKKANFCDDAKKVHLDNPQFSNHSVVSFFTDKIEFGFEMPIFCLTHNREYEQFCFTDRTLLCTLCIKKDHKKHEYKSIDYTFKLKSKEFIALSDKAKKMGQKLQQKAVEIKGVETDVEVTRQETKNAIDAHFAELEAYLAQRKKILKAEVDRIADEKKRLLESNHPPIGSAIKKISAVTEEVDEILQKESQVHVLHMEKQLHEKLDSINSKQLPSLRSFPVSKLQLAYVPETKQTDAFKEIISTFGSVQEYTPTPGGEEEEGGEDLQIHGKYSIASSRNLSTSPKGFSSSSSSSSSSSALLFNDINYGNNNNSHGGSKHNKNKTNGISGDPFTDTLR